MMAANQKEGFELPQLAVHQEELPASQDSGRKALPCT